MSNKTFLKSMLLATMILAGTSSAFSRSFSSREYASPQPVAHQAEAVSTTREDYPFEGTKLPGSQLSVRLMRSTITDHTQAYDVIFSSAVEGHTFQNLGGEKNTYIRIVDPEYDPNKPNGGTSSKVEEESGKPLFYGQAFRIRGVDPLNGKIVIPELLKSGTKFFIETTSINRDLIDAGCVDTKEKTTTIKEIYIPKSVKTIDPDAFRILKENNIKSVVFNILSNKTDEGITFDDSVFPAGSKINWGYSLEPNETDTDEVKQLKADVTKVITQSRVTVPPGEFYNGYNFALGYNDEENEAYKDLFLEVAYFVNDEKTPRTLQIKSDDFKGYDALGESVGAKTVSKNINIPLKEGEVVDDNAIYFLNIYPLNPTTKKPILVDSEGNSLKSYVKAKTVGKKHHIDDFVDLKFDKITTLGDYISVNAKVDVKVTKETPKLYMEFKPDVYKQYKAEINSGECHFRTIFSGLNSGAYLNFKYLNSDGELVVKPVRLESKYTTYVLKHEKGNDLNFLIREKRIGEDFDIKNLRGLEFENFNVNIDIFSSKTQKPVVKSDLSTRFGTIDIINPTTEKIPSYSIDIALIITYCVYIALFLGITIGYFFYAKNKYKNDEFKRIKPKQYIKTASIAFLSIAIVITDLMLIFYRFWQVNNSTTVYNPLDIPVIVFSIATILVIGYYVKFFAGMYKAHKEKKKIEKLKLNEDVDSDGTK